MKQTRSTYKTGHVFKYEIGTGRLMKQDTVRLMRPDTLRLFELAFILLSLHIVYKIEVTVKIVHAQIHEVPNAMLR